MMKYWINYDDYLAMRLAWSQDSNEQDFSS